MTLYHLPPREDVRLAIAAGKIVAVHNRIVDLANRGGYSLGPGGIAVFADGSVVIDTDSDPSPAWSSFDPAIPTPDETAVEDEKRQLEPLIASLKAGTATNRQVQAALGRLLERALEEWA